MAPVSRSSKTGCSTIEEECYGTKGDRKVRKPLVEKKRRARINESLQELRSLLADADLQSKMENAEVLEMTVKRVEHVLQNQTQEADALNREANERFAAGYIQCMHEVHMYVSNCPGIDPTVAAELLNHLLECMPLNGDHFQDILVDLISDTPINSNVWYADEENGAILASLGDVNGVAAAFSPASSTASGDESFSDLDDSNIEQGHHPQSPESREDRAVQTVPTTAYLKSVWRPW